MASCRGWVASVDSLQICQERTEPPQIARVVESEPRSARYEGASYRRSILVDGLCSGRVLHTS
jgi:hypothetical protein